MSKSIPRVERELREENEKLRKRIEALEEEAQRAVLRRVTIARGTPLDPTKLTVGTISYPCTE